MNTIKQQQQQQQQRPYKGFHHRINNYVNSPFGGGTSKGTATSSTANSTNYWPNNGDISNEKHSQKFKSAEGSSSFEVNDHTKTPKYNHSILSCNSSRIDSILNLHIKVDERMRKYINSFLGTLKDEGFTDRKGIEEGLLVRMNMRYVKQAPQFWPPYKRHNQEQPQPGHNASTE